MHLLPGLRYALLTGMIVLLAVTSASASNAERFPRYNVIAPNVAFWTQIYSRYTTRQAVIHDSRDLGIVYDVIAVAPYDAPGARRINRARLKRAKAKYRGLLERLAADPAAPDADSRRVAALFGTGADAAVFRQASRRVRSQLGQKDRFREGLVRSGAYLDEIRAILKSYKVPEDLAYLPHVESSFNPKAYSKFGAAGIWQFTRSTGRRFMTVDYVMDERRDPIHATHAAARLLAENYARLGSWPLAITAYNHGAAGMARAKAKHGDYPAIFANYRSRTFKFASRNFYAEFLAAREVAANYKDHFGPLTLASPTPTHTVTLGGYARIEDLSDHFGLSTEVLRRLNPALRPPVFSGQKYVPKGYRLRLPKARTGATHLAAIPSSLFKSDQKPSRFYTVQRGDTAGRIARAHGVRLSDLILANNLSTRATIYPNQTLRIPVPGETLQASVQPSAPPVAAASEPEAATAQPTTPSAAEQTLLAAAPSQQQVSKPTDASVSATPAAEETQATQTIASVETAEILVAEAEEEAETGEPSAPTAGTRPGTEAFHETPTAPAPAAAEPPEKPGIPASPTGSGQKPTTVPETAIPEKETRRAQASLPAETILRDQPPAISAGHPSGESPAAAAALVPTPEIVAIDVRFARVTEVKSQPVGILQVEVEETLGHFAEWAGVRTQQIRRLNGLRYGRTLHLHQTVKIPLDEVTAAAFEEQRYEYHKRLQEDFFAVYRIAELKPYRVQPGDNIWTLCRETFGVPLWLIKHYNMDADLAALRVAQKLMVPEIAETAAGEPGTVNTEDGMEEPEPEAAEEVPPQSRRDGTAPWTPMRMAVLIGR